MTDIYREKERTKEGEGERDYSFALWCFFSFQIRIHICNGVTFKTYHIDLSLCSRNCRHPLLAVRATASITWTSLCYYRLQNASVCLAVSQGCFYCNVHHLWSDMRISAITMWVQSTISKQTAYGLCWLTLH